MQSGENWIQDVQMLLQTALLLNRNVQIIPYYGDAQCVIVNSNSEYKTLDDLAGKTIGITNGQAAQTIIEDMADEKGYTVKLYEDSAVGMNDLMLERIDAYANTTTNVNAFSHNNEKADFLKKILWQIM